MPTLLLFFIEIISNSHYIELIEYLEIRVQFLPIFYEWLHIFIRSFEELFGLERKPCCNYPSLTFLPNFILCDLINQTLIEIRLNITNLFLNILRKALKIDLQALHSFFGQLSYDPIFLFRFSILFFVGLIHLGYEVLGEMKQGSTGYFLWVEIKLRAVDVS